ncbi:hypothetical protein GCM10023085_39580 [Actinomadura viridis]|uniref:Prevent-host-death family protein n=1 Tax=Actinomadura viridis TaxID=58110 RepID=A0A931DKA3_9ACTN|nr:hypothetical protein [Actinomadura viridis]MBG6092759.1 hypothetical protein [Actinomadura viridis]
MSELLVDDPHETIHLGDHTAVVVPLDEYLRLREAQVEAEQLAAHRDYLDRKASGTAGSGMTTDEVRRLLAREVNITHVARV